MASPLETLKRHFDYDEAQDRYDADLNDIVDVVDGFTTAQLQDALHGMLRSSGAFVAQLDSRDPQYTAVREAAAELVARFAHAFYVGEADNGDY